MPADDDVDAWHKRRERLIFLRAQVSQGDHDIAAFVLFEFVHRFTSICGQRSDVTVDVEWINTVTTDAGLIGITSRIVGANSAAQGRRKSDRKLCGRYQRCIKSYEAKKTDLK